MAEDHRAQENQRSGLRSVLISVVFRPVSDLGLGQIYN